MKPDYLIEKHKSITTQLNFMTTNDAKKKIDKYHGPNGGFLNEQHQRYHFYRQNFDTA